MRRLRTISTRRLYGLVAVVVLLAATAGIAQAALTGSASAPPHKPLDRAVFDALRAPDVQGVSARIEFTNGLLPAGSLRGSGASPLLAGATGRIWVAGDGRFRVELQSDRGDAQIVDDGSHVTIYDPASKTAYVAPTGSDRGKPHNGTPPTLADVQRGLKRLATSWTLSGARPGTTGGQPSYTVRIAPKDDGGLLGAAELAWDATHGVPLRAAVYAQGNDKPVLEVKASDVSFGRIAGSDLAFRPPAGTKTVQLDAPQGAKAPGHGKPIRGAAAVSRQLAFPLAAPAKLAGLPRTSVRLVRMGDANGALSTYGQGMGAIAVLQSKGTEQIGNQYRLPQINIDGATGSELATPLGTVLTFSRNGVTYVVAGSVPPVAAENAARGLR
jgi:outer membrane lipoprotein-sorting protein